MRGFYNNIPNHYSHELNIIINMLLQFNPNNRPTCNQILDNSIIKTKIENIFGFSGVNLKKEISNILPNKIKSVKSSKDIIKLLPKFKNYKNEIGKAFLKMIELFIIIIVLLIFLEYGYSYFSKK